MSEESSGQLDIRSIVEHTRSVLRAGFSSHEVALDALQKIEVHLKREFEGSDQQLEPLTQFMAELSKQSLDVAVARPIAVSHGFTK
jgi:hypothetical protein